MQHDKQDAEFKDLGCWWIFFHKWSIWVDTTGGMIQRRRCDKCGKAEERLV